jgi:hypothetical protein
VGKMTDWYKEAMKGLAELVEQVYERMKNKPR